MVPSTLKICPQPTADSAQSVIDAIEPLLIDTAEAARAVGISSASWFRLKSAGKTPGSIKLGGRVLYRLADIRSWVAMGCPPKKEFEIRRAADLARAARAV
jgi:predicted DNA-binding transcriptional regulator AlpA